MEPIEPNVARPLVVDLFVGEPRIHGEPSNEATVMYQDIASRPKHKVRRFAAGTRSTTRAPNRR